MKKDIGFIINPTAANGKGGKIWPDLKQELIKRFGSSFKWKITEYSEHAVELTRRLIHEDVKSIIAIGGDGTLNEVVNGFFHQGKLINSSVSLGTLSIGTGADFIRTSGWPKELPLALDRIELGKTRKIDIGKVQCKDQEGNSVVRHFINIADFGFGAEVVRKVNSSTKYFGGKITYLAGILSTLITYKNKKISYKLDDGDWSTDKMNILIAGNGGYFGGGMNPAPMAELDDGQLDIIVIGDTNFFEVLKNLSSLRKGTHLDHPKINAYIAKKIQVKSDESVFVDLDGELAGQLPAIVEIIPKVINILY